MHDSGGSIFVGMITGEGRVSHNSCVSHASHVMCSSTISPGIEMGLSLCETEVPASPKDWEGQCDVTRCCEEPQGRTECNLKIRGGLAPS